MSNAQYFSGKVSYAKKLIKRTDNAKLKTAGKYEDSKLFFWNKAIDYCEQWVRYFEEGDTRMQDLLDIAIEGKRSAVEVNEFLAAEAVERWTQKQAAKNMYRQMTN